MLTTSSTIVAEVLESMVGQAQPTRLVRRPLAPILLAATIAIHSFAIPAAWSADFAVATSEAAATSTASADNIRQIFTGSVSAWPDGNPIVLVLPPADSPEMKWLCESIVRLPCSGYRRHLLDQVVRGTLDKPIYVDSGEGMKSVLLSRTGAVGPLATSSLGDGVKAVIIE